jgi:protein-S-isoprenylcysteine O-methyltransferase Ste14
MFSKINPPIIYQSFIVLMMAIYFLFADTTVIRFPYNLAGVAIFLIGSYLAISEKKSFQKANTPMPPLSKPNTLHTGGAFRYTRNPMYLGITIGLLGLAFLMSCLVNFAFPLLFFIIMDVVYVRREEQVLEEQFGDQYLDYKNRVRRWI